MKFEDTYQKYLKIYSEQTTPVDFIDIRTGDLVVIKKDCFKNPYLKELENSTTGQRIREMMETKNNLVVSAIKNIPPASYGAYGSHAQNTLSDENSVFATVSEQYSDGLHKNVVEIPIACLQRVDTGNNLRPISPNQVKQTKQHVQGQEPVVDPSMGDDPTKMTHASYKDHGINKLK